jgi:carbamoylphosphate synthase large subunit
MTRAPVLPVDVSPRLLHLVSPDSLRSWFAHFVTLGAGDQVRWLGEDPALTPDVTGQLLAATKGADLIVIHSSHHTLIRDVTLAGTLGAGGSRVMHQSPKAALLGTDKIAMKRIFDESGIPTPPWRHRYRGPTVAEFRRAHDGPFVVKLRNGTEGRELRLRPSPDPDLSNFEFEEPFVDGVEYSVVIFRAPGRNITFPTIWKGATRRDLLPPYRRLRLCPAPDLSPERDAALRALSLRAAEVMDSDGFTEVELVVSADEEVYVIEVNPRIAGTMRMAALATDTLIFDLPGMHDVVGDLASGSCSVEMPWLGEPWNDPQQRVYCTSRLTAAAASWGDVLALVDSVIDGGTSVPLEWRRSFDLALKELCLA